MHNYLIRSSRFSIEQAVFALTVTWLLLADVAIAAPHQVSACLLPDGSSLPEASRCKDEWKSVLDARPAGQSLTEGLYTLADSKIAESDIPSAKRVLICAAAQIKDANDWRGQYEVIRRYGILDYKQHHVASAIGRFECALTLAKTHNDRAATAKQLKNIGSGLRRIGDYDAALAALTESLAIQREIGDTTTGAVLNNIADVYRETKRPIDAERYYLQALDAFRRDKNTVESMHLYDSLSELAFDRGDINAANKLLQVALKELDHEDNRSYRPSILAGLARAARLQGDTTTAYGYVNQGLELSKQYALPMSVELQIEAARVERLTRRTDAALNRLRTALADTAQSNLERAALLQELANVLETSGRNVEAIKLLRQAHALESRDANEQNSQRLAWLQERFAATERERTIAKLQDQNDRRRLMLWLLTACSIAALLLLTMLFSRRQQRARIAQAATAARYEEMLLRYRREADTLTEDRYALQALLDSREDALCLIDAEGLVLAVNRAAVELLKIDLDKLSGAQLADHFDSSEAIALKVAFENMEDTASQSLVLAASEMRPKLRIEMKQWHHGNGLVVLGLSEVTQQFKPASKHIDADTSIQSIQSHDVYSSDDSTDTNTDRSEIVDTLDADIRQEFRRGLVALMLHALDAWERSSGQSRIEFAERSRIWRVNIDDGRLRARAMERYLSVSKLPQNPRWRDVLRSAYYVMGQCTLEPSQREDLQQHVDKVLTHTRRDAFA
jgi:two-component system, sensor histidine kinase ChiS